MHPIDSKSPSEPRTGTKPAPEPAAIQLKEEIVGLLKSKDLSTEEKRRILEIATSLNSMPLSGSGRDATDGISKLNARDDRRKDGISTTAKMSLLIFAVVSIILIVAAMFLLKGITGGARGYGDRSAVSPADSNHRAPSGPGHPNKGPIRPADGGNRSAPRP